MKKTFPDNWTSFILASTQCRLWEFTLWFRGVLIRITRRQVED